MTLHVGYIHSCMRTCNAWNQQPEVSQKQDPSSEARLRVDE